MKIQIKTDSIGQNGNIIIEFDLEGCCKKDVGKYLFFESNSAVIVNRKCDNIESTIALILETSKNFKIIGIVTDSSNYQTTKQRIQYVSELLLQKGIPQNRFSTEVSTHYKNKYPPSGSSSILYPNEEDCLYRENCELGIIIEQDE